MNFDLLFRNIKVARTKAGFSQKGMAARLGVSDKTVSAYETGRAIPPTAVLARISNLTNTPVGKLLGMEDEEKEVIKYLEQLSNRVTNLELSLIKLGNKE